MKRAPVLMTALLLRVLLLAIVSLPMLGAASAQQASSTICSGISRTELLNTATNGGAMPFFGGEAAGLAYDPTNNDLYIAENPFPFQNLGSPQVLKIHLADNTKTILAPQGGFGDVSALAFYGGNLYVADGNGYANSFYTQPVPLNVVWQYAPANGTWTKVVTGINDPTGLAFDSSGNMYVSSWTDMNVYEYANNAGTFSSTRLTRWTAPTPSESPYGLAIDQGNNLYIAGFGQSYNTQTKIFKVDPSGNSSIFADPGITEPTALAFDANGYLYASYYDSLKILRIAPDGSYVVYPGGGTVADAANGIALSPQGDLFTVVNGSSTVDGQAAVLQLHGLVPSVNAAAEFSATANPNSAWSYGSTNGSGFTLLSTSTNMPATVSNTSQSASPGLDFWTGSGLGADLFHNGTGAYLSLTCCSALAPGALGLQPGTTGNYATLRWTSPFAGTYQIMGLMTGLDFSGPTNVNGSVTYNGSTSLFSQSVSGFGTPSAVPFLGQATVAACETLDATIAGGSNNLSTGLDVLVLPAPSATPFTFSPLPSPFWFGSQAVGTATNFTVNVTNAGVSSYSLSQSTIVGASNTDFTITSDTCSDTTIAAAIGTCSLTVQFLPMALGARSATLVLNTGAPQLPVATLPVAGVGVANATTIVAANPSPGLYGQPVTLTATVTGPAGLGNPTSGSVNFYDGSSLLGNAALNNGSQSLLPVSSLSIGAHTITAVYVPAAGSAYMGVSGSSLPETIAPGPPTVTFTGAPASAAYNSTFTVTASTNASATATITPAGVCTIAGNLVTMTSGTGTCKLTANWPGDSNYLAASATQTTTATTATSAVALVSSANPVQLGQSVTFTATVTPGTPTGSVTFLDGSTALSTSALAGGSATFMTSALAAGSHSLTASYGGDTNFAASTSAATTISVLPPQVVVITDNETVTVTDAVSFPDVFNAEAVHVADVVFVTPLINVAAPVVDYSAGSLGFSNVPAGQSGTQSLTLSDIGQAPLTVSSAAVSQDSAFSISQIGCSNGATSLPTTLPVGGTCIFLVSYLAPSGAAMNDVLTFTDNAALSNMASLQAGSSYTQSIPLVGSGTSTSAPPAPPAVIPVVDNEAIQVTDTSSFPDVFDSEKITVTDQVIIKIISTTSISPTSGSQGYNVPVTINGTGLAGATAINVSGGGITVSGLTMSDTQVSASFNIAPTATLGARSVTVTTPGGTSNAVTFTVTAPPPTLTSMSPNSGALGYSVPVTLTGTWLASTTGINVSGTGVTASNIIVVNDTTITATFIISPGTASAGTALGPRNVTVTTAGGTSNAVTFTVNAPPPPTLTSIAPASGVLGNSVPVTITGTWLATTTAINISGAGVTVSGLTVVSDTTVTATFNIATTAALAHIA